MAVLVVVASGWAVCPPVAQAAALSPVQAAAAGPLEATDEAAASAMAYRYRKPVLVTGMTSPTSMVWAQPDGTFRAEVQSAPVRARTAQGGWADVDLALERKADGSVGPKVDPHGLWLSGARAAGSDALVQVGAGEQRTALGWRGALPEPVLTGSTATYRNVKPDVDLVVEARSTGFRYSFLVHTPQAAAGMATVSMPWSSGTQSAGLAAVTTAGSPVEVSQGEVWDARVSASGEPLRRADVTVATEVVDGQTSLVTTPDPAFLSGAGLVYPITIDPSINLSPAFDAYVQDTISSTDKSADDELRLGYVVDANEGCASACLARSFLSFHNLDGFAGSDVISAELFLWNFHSYSCTAAQWESWRVGSVGSAVRWGSQPTWYERDGLSTGTKGYNSGCADGQVSISVKNTFQLSFDSNWSSANVGLKASTENGNIGWKKFNSSEAASGKPYVTVVYNRQPNAPTQLAINSCYSACTSPAIVRSGTPTLSAIVSDPNGGTLRAEYEVYNYPKSNWLAKSGTAVTGVTSGTARPWQVTPKLADGSYHFRVRGCDTYTCGPYSVWFTFTVNTQEPTLPTVTGTPYAEQSSGTWNGGPGTPGTFTFGPNGATDVQEYIYRLNDENAVTVLAGAAQSQILTDNQQQVSTDLTGFAGINATISRDTSRGHNSTQSLKVAPLASGGTTSGPQGDTFASLGGDYGALRLEMQAGKRYWITGWIYVPAATGLAPSGSVGTARGLRILGFYKTGSQTIGIASPMATVVDGWQQLSVVMTVPAGATEAYVRLYNGFPVGQSGKVVYWDDLSVREVVGTTATQTITPTRDGINQLIVHSRNAAGATSDPRSYQFIVAPSDGRFMWTFDNDTAGTAASTPNGFPGAYSATGAVPLQPGHASSGAASFDGSGDVRTSLPVLDTDNTAGFTIAAWVRPTDLTTPRTAVSQLGTANAMFRLGFRNDVDVDGDAVTDPAWCFTVTATDSATAPESRACTTEYVVLNDWVSLVGVFDKPSNTIWLYVKGTADIGGAVVPISVPSSWSADGSLVIGAGSTTTDRWVGDIDEVNAAQRVWGGRTIDQYASQ